MVFFFFFFNPLRHVLYNVDPDPKPVLKASCPLRFFTVVHRFTWKNIVEIFENWNVVSGVIVSQRHNSSSQIFLQLNRYI